MIKTNRNSLTLCIIIGAATIILTTNAMSTQIVSAVEVLEEGDGDHDEEGETHSVVQEHQEENGTSYSPLSPDKAQTYSPPMKQK